MAQDPNHIRDALVSLGMTNNVDFKQTHLARDQWTTHVTSKYGLRTLVERRELVVAADLHISFIAGPDGKAIAAAASVADGKIQPGFYQVLLSPDGKPVAERPLTFDGEDKKQKVKPQFIPRTSGPRRGRAGSGEGAGSAAARSAREMGAERLAEPPRARAGASVREGVLFINTTRRVARALVTWIEEAGHASDDIGADLLGILSVHAGSRGRCTIKLDRRSLAARLEREARDYAIEARDWGVDYAVLSRSANRLRREIRRALDGRGVESSASNRESGKGRDSTKASEREAKEGAIMASGTKKSGSKKAGSKKSGSKTAGKGKSRSRETEQEETSSRRKITEDIAQRAADMREEGSTWVEVEEELGFNGAQLRPHIAKLNGDKIPGLKKSPQSVAKARNDGHAWYAIAASLNLSVAEVKEMAEEGGADTEGRVYRGGDEDEDDAPKAKKGSAKKGSAKAGKGKTKTAAGKKRGSKKADPSEED